MGGIARHGAQWPSWLGAAIDEIWFREYSQGFLSPQLLAQSRTTVANLPPEALANLRRIRYLITTSASRSPKESIAAIAGPSDARLATKVGAPETLALIALAEHFVDGLLLLPRKLRDADIALAGEVLGIGDECFRQSVRSWYSIREGLMPLLT